MSQPQNQQEKKDIENVTAGPQLSSLEDKPEAAAKQPRDEDEAAPESSKAAATTYKTRVGPLHPYTGCKAGNNVELHCVFETHR